ncbi:hypothetical protein M413DRAFT_449546, partial [Hebeloma cylindrosporum]
MVGSENNIGCWEISVQPLKHGAEKRPLSPVPAVVNNGCKTKIWKWGSKKNPRSSVEGKSSGEI